MLRELRVKNFAVIESATVEFAAGLNVLTGETGAGKSMLIDALLLVRGARAQSDVIRADADAATVEAVFTVDRHSAAGAVLDDAGLAAADSEIVIRRELSRSGRHRAFVNDSPVTVGLLERPGDELVDVHGQHEHQRLLQSPVQLALLDRFADADERAEYAAALFGKYRSAGEDVVRTSAAARDRAQREDLLRFQVSELAAARLRAGEEEELRTERKRVQHAERLVSGLAEVAALLDDDAHSAQARLARALRVLADLGRIDPAFAAPAEALEGARLQVEDALASMRGLRDGVTAEPGRLEAIDDRLDALARLKRKYGDTEEAMIRFAADAADELDRLARHDEVLAQQERALADVRAELVAAANALSDARRAAAARLATLVEKQMRGLGMERAMFEIAVEAVAFEAITARGVDRVEFRLSTNPGEEMKPLARVASGG